MPKDDDFDNGARSVPLEPQPLTLRLPKDRHADFNTCQVTLDKTKSCADFIPLWSDLNAPSPSKMERIYVALGLTCRQQSILKIHFFFVQLHIQIRMCLKGRGLCPLLAEAVRREESWRRKRKRIRENRGGRKKLWAREIET